MSKKRGGTGGDEGDVQAREAAWEERATELALKGGGAEGAGTGVRVDGVRVAETAPRLPALGIDGEGAADGIRETDAEEQGRLADAKLQEAIRLHEAGELTASTKLFAQLAGPSPTSSIPHLSLIHI